ncbi:N-acetylglucosaminyltransferase-like protein [Halteromyces radiatus]|uniref:N-acetylglucosaminyltransferase-like protein n=1 Tax=Halteromyces radiatus TaxID=101107 RepID=UPI00221F234D|nr:N-acetylglucosaminyltransferase-like protein [Halteromyces radiatus]KAI8093478.1 N-acetylglucosaminyltransferase-like protein [Halteromyces radiatus]
MNQKQRYCILFTLLFFALSTLGILYRSPGLVTDLGYYTRPIWDKESQSFDYQRHFYANEVPMKELCELNGWTFIEDKNQPKPKVYDAVIFSVELDLLEIRLHELWDVVDHFIILESNSTFTGATKPLTFLENQERFLFAKDKIYHKVIYQQGTLPDGETPFYNENAMRHEMNQVFKDLGVAKDDWVIMSDVDEIIRGKTLQLITQCQGVPRALHLQLRNYLYSFEFFVDYGSWRAHIERYDPDSTQYGHYQITPLMLADAGWHCSFCFKELTDFQFKMQSYSHADRVRDPSLLELDRIQKVICDGGDIFGYPPEAYTYKDLINKMGNVPKLLTGGGLPDYVLSNGKKFNYLLPGGCIRH